jgi:hypothetical protein
MSADRNPNGTFAKGYKGGPGRPKGLPTFNKLAARGLLQQLADEVTPERWVAIARKAIEQAERGDRHARQWLSDCLLGKEPLLTLELLDAYLDVEAKVTEKNRLAAELLQLQKASRPAAYDPTAPDPIDKFCVQDEPRAAVPRDDVDLLADTAFAFGEPSKPAPRVVYNIGGRLVAADDDDDVGRILRG